jgi:hypothetical protein
MAISKEELLRRVNSDLELRTGIEEFLPLSIFLRHCILDSDYSYPDDLSESLTLTAEGFKAKELLYTIDPGLSLGDIYAILFAVFSHEDVFIDFSHSSSDGLARTISREILENRIRYPFTYHRQLLDRYFYLFGNQYIHNLNSNETQLLLKGTSQGVFQIGKFCVGPYGLLRSGHSRFIPIQNEARIAQCDKPSCQFMHSVKWTTSDTKAGEAFGKLDQRIKLEWSNSAPWNAIIRDFLFPDEKFYKQITSDGLLQLISNSLADDELKELFRNCLNDPATELRPALNRVVPGASNSSAEVILGKLDRPEILQLLLLISDEEICRIIDVVVLSGQIKFEQTEVRFPKFATRPIATFLNNSPQISQLGVRFADSDNAMLFLMNYIKSSMDSVALEWELMSVEGISTDEKLDRLINESEVRDLIERFVFRSKDSFESVLNYLSYGSFDFPKTRLERELLIDKFMWKFGFQIAQSNDSSEVLRQRLTELEESVKERPGDVDELRATSLHVFVALETFLDETISFVTYCLMGDHILGVQNGRFGYSITSGREFVHRYLNDRTRSAGTAIKLTSDGKTTLFGLLHSFRELSFFIQECLENETFEEQTRRPLDEFPSWATEKSSLLFPFDHSVFFYDLEESKLREVLDVLSRVTQILVGAKVDAVRNRVPHGNREFPNVDELSLVLTACDEVLSLLESYGCTANRFVLTESITDRHGRVTRWYESRQGRRVRLRPNSELRSSGIPVNSSNLLMFHGVTIKGTAECPRFIARFESPFDEMWRNVPRAVEREIDVSDFSAVQSEMLN